MASHQSVINLNIIIKFPIWHNAFVSLCSAVPYKRQWNENRTPATKWQWNLFYTKVIATSVNTFIPLGDETISSSLVERGRSLMDPQPHPLLHLSSEWNQCPRMSFFRSPKMWKSQGESSWLYGGCWSVFQPNLWSLLLLIIKLNFIFQLRKYVHRPFNK